MKGTITTLGVLFLALVPGTALAAPARSPSTVDYAAIDHYVSDQMSDAHIPGLALGIVHGDQVVHLHGFGEADRGGTAVTSTTPFFIGSLSKSFTALAVMQLEEAGKLDLDTPVRQYLPEFRLEDESASAKITVRQLLNQTSGIPTEAGITPLSQRVTSLEDQVGALASVRPASQPGQHYAYSNANYEVLGRIVEVASGQGYSDYLTSHLLTPLQMQATYTSLDQGKAAGLASAASLWFGTPQWHQPGAGFRADTVPAGFIMSSVQDMSHYLVAQMNGGHYGDREVLSSAGMATLHRGVASAGVSADGGSYAMGWFSGPRGHVPDLIWHNGSAASMHAMVEMAPAKRWGVVVLANTESLLYEFLARFDVIADNVMATLLGRPLAGTLAGLYLAFDAIAALFLIVIVRNLVRIVRRPRKIRIGRLAEARAIFFEWIIPIWREFWVPMGILLGVPAILGAPWMGNLLTTDVGQWLFTVAILLLASGLTRLTLAIWRVFEGRRMAPRPHELLEMSAS